MEKSAGQIAYGQDVERRPNYEDGTRRPTWEELGNLYEASALAAVRKSWEDNPTPRWSENA